MTKPRGSGQTPEGWAQEPPRSAPRYLERAEWQKYDDRAREGASGSRITRNSSEMRPAASPNGDIYAPLGGYPYPEEIFEGHDLRERERELEEYLRR
jgi:gentisate 1,2-dioxygenase